MNTFRYGVAVLVLLSVPVALGLWVCIHPFARSWRRVGPAWTYIILLLPAALVARWSWVQRDRLLGADCGAQPMLITMAVFSFAAAVAIARRRRGLLTQRILIGVPELSRTDKGRLLTTGIYSRTRNPRYLEFLLFVFAYIAVANYLGTWILFALTLPLLHLVVLLEERELRDRFGAEYR